MISHKYFYVDTILSTYIFNINPKISDCETIAPVSQYYLNYFLQYARNYPFHSYYEFPEKLCSY